MIVELINHQDFWTATVKISSMKRKTYRGDTKKDVQEKVMNDFPIGHILWSEKLQAESSWSKSPYEKNGIKYMEWIQTIPLKGECFHKDTLKPERIALIQSQMKRPLKLKKVTWKPQFDMSDIVFYKQSRMFQKMFWIEVIGLFRIEVDLDSIDHELYLENKFILWKEDPKEDIIKLLIKRGDIPIPMEELV